VRRGAKQRGKQSEQGAEQCRREGVGFPSLNLTEDNDKWHGGIAEKPRQTEMVGVGGGLGQNVGHRWLWPGVLAQRAGGDIDQWAPLGLDIFKMNSSIGSTSNSQQNSSYKIWNKIHFEFFSNF
jgi:hypothetical protein